MKKILLSLALATFGLTVNSYAQTIFSQDFESATIPALPTGWSQHSTGTPGWVTTTNGGSTWGGLTGAYNVPAHTTYVIVDDAANPPNYHDTLKSAVFSMAAYTPAQVFLTYDYFFYNATLTATGQTETCYIVGSSDGGTTWAILDSVYGNAWNADSWSTAHVSLGTLSGANCMIGFAYANGGSSTGILGCALDNIIVSVPPANEIALTAITPVAPNDFAQTGGSKIFGGTMYNNGSTSITSFQATYVVGAGAPVTTTITPATAVAPFTYYNFTTTAYTPVASGSSAVTMWVTEAGDPVLTNDTMTTTIVGVDTLEPKVVMIEEFNQASCDPCADAAPNVDSVYANNLTSSILVRYHVSWPGQDFMNQVTQTPFIGAMVSFYSVGGVPDAQMDGQYIYPGAGGLSTPAIQALATLGSPLKINVTSYFDAATETYSFTATIKSFTNLPAGLKARAVLTVDKLTYTNNQSTESIPQYDFPEVAESMFGSGPNGTTLGAFAAESTQTFSSTWVKNHRWAAVSSATWDYDSTSTGKIVVWVEDDAAKVVYQAAYATVSTAGPLGVNAVTTNNGSMDVYPNPATSTATVAVKLNVAADVKMEVYNMAGQVVYSMPAESRNAGTSVSSINLANLANGDYFVRVSVGADVLTKTLTVAK